MFGYVLTHSGPSSRPRTCRGTSPAREGSRGRIDGCVTLLLPSLPSLPSPSCQLPSWLLHPAPGTMASSEEDGTVEEKENNNKKRTKSALATAWLTFYNIAMTAG